MCDLCGRMNCLPRCPNYRDPHAVRCRECGVRLLDGDRYYQLDGNPYCAECVESARIEDLVRICEVEQEELLERLGLHRRCFASGKEPYG